MSCTIFADSLSVLIIVNSFFLFFAIFSFRKRVNEYGCLWIEQWHNMYRHQVTHLHSFLLVFFPTSSSSSSTWSSSSSSSVSSSYFFYLFAFAFTSYYLRLNAYCHRHSMIKRLNLTARKKNNNDGNNKHSLASHTKHWIRVQQIEINNNNENIKNWRQFTFNTRKQVIIGMET